VDIFFPSGSELEMVESGKSLMLPDRKGTMSHRVAWHYLQINSCEPVLSIYN